MVLLNEESKSNISSA